MEMKQEMQLSIALKMLMHNVPIEKVMSITELSLEQVQELFSKLPKT